MTTTTMTKRNSVSLPTTMLPLLLLLILLPSVSGAATASAAPSSECTTSLANGFIVTRSCVNDCAAIGLDLSDIYQALHVANATDSSDFATARTIYTQGKNSFIIDASGQTSTKRRTIQSFSTSATTGTYKNNPSFYFYLYGLSQQNVTALSQYFTFADNYVSNVLLNDVSTNILAYEAMVVLNVLNYCMYEIWNMMTQCEYRMNGIVTTTNSNNQARGASAASTAYLGSGGVAMLPLDSFIAYYIGDGQVSGPGTSGSSLYALAQIAGKLFNTLGTNIGIYNSTSGGSGNQLANVNTNIKTIYEEAAGFLSASNACRPGTSTVEYLHLSANKLLAQMNVIIMQMLLQAIYQMDQDRISIYGLSLIPQLSKCKPTTFQYLKYTLLDKNYNKTQYVQVLGALQSTYECLGFTCADVGTYGNGLIAQCADPPMNLAMAGYTPDSDTHEQALIDLDVLEMQGLTQMGLFLPASRIYVYGKHSILGTNTDDGTTLMRTLQSMAINVGALQIALPYYAIFSTFYSDATYADSFVMDAMSSPPRGKWALASIAQRSEFITKTIQYQVVYMYALYAFRGAIADCNDGSLGSNEVQIRAFEQGVAFLVGSLEGYATGGADPMDGMLQFNLAQRRAVDFGTDENPSKAVYAHANDELLDLLYAGKAQLDSGACQSSSAVVDRIMQVTLIPLMQSVIRYAFWNKNAVAPFTDTNGDLAAGEAFARSILPLVYAESVKSGLLLENNMFMTNGTTPVSDGPQAVANALKVICIAPEYDAISCGDIGTFDGVSIQGSRPQGSVAGAMSSASTGAHAVISIWLMGLCSSMILIVPSIAAFN